MVARDSATVQPRFSERKDYNGDTLIVELIGPGAVVAVTEGSELDLG